MRLAALPTSLEGLPWRMLIPLTLLVCFGAAVLWRGIGEDDRRVFRQVREKVKRRNGGAEAAS